MGKRNQDSKFEPLMGGVSLMQWDEFGYRLYAIEERSLERILVFSFGKCCLNRGVSGMTYVRQVIYCEDRLLVVQSEDTNELKMLHLNLPVSYISQNWPVQHVAASKDIRFKKWRLFGDIINSYNLETDLSSLNDSNSVEERWGYDQRKPDYWLQPTPMLPNHLVSQKMAAPSMVPVNHVEKLEKFNGLNFKRWQQKMLFYLTPLNLARSADCRLLKKKKDREANIINEMVRDMADINLSVVVSEVNLIGSNPKEW
ncbi:hypothetical protein CRG98_041345 [Punica granatum]|uniref:Uncharacterized protein n=1 Tax=Punica granatum TaxID=22663 RepID=A0A2I0I2U4_PUNGR|nr:hypothetical protein CRG98_041345 [Punica granatum]